MNNHSTVNGSTPGQEKSVMDCADGLIAAIRAYERGRGSPPLTLLGDSEVEAFFGTIPTLSPAQFERLETLVQIDRDRRDSEHDDEIEPRFAFAEVA